ncbi:hypothetical protein C8R46DRAFT_1172892 [Mycena filopes]|nr:hypothetical protein C8R46DRAFT_1172892 [Mycena filopes]
MTNLTALMAMGESHTKSVESTVQAALAQKKLKEEQRRKQQEEQERKQRELETKLRLRYFEEQKRKTEVEAKLAQERQAQQADLLRREAEVRDALRYGPKKAKSAAGKWPTSSSGVREEVRRKRLPDDDDDDMGGGIPLTREEKRERKLQAELKRAFQSPRRTNSATGGYRKTGGRLPGGAYDVATTSADKIAATSGPGNVKDRLAKMPNTLTRLNVVKRDTRTIDEIVRDRRENKEVLNGDQARGFDDWFTPSSRAPPKKEKAPVASSSASSSSSRPSSQPLPPPPAKRTSAPAATPKPRPKASASTLASSSAKKRPRSLSASRSSSPPPSKRAHLASASSSRPMKPSKSTSRPRSHSPLADEELSSTIWSIFGKDKAAYTARDVLSDSEDDDSDMEAGASALEYEEKVSSRIARKEEREAELAERRHEEEKRRRKAAAAGRG